MRKTLVFTTVTIAALVAARWQARAPISFAAAEQIRLRAHFDSVERELRARDVPGLTNADLNWQPSTPEMRVKIDRQKAASLGLSFSEIADTVNTAVITGRRMKGSERFTSSHSTKLQDSLC